MSVIYPTNTSPVMVQNTGPGPRQPLGLPPRLSGASPPPQKTPPMTPAAPLSKAALPGPMRQGQQFLPAPGSSHGTFGNPESA